MNPVSAGFFAMKKYLISFIILLTIAAGTILSLPATADVLQIRWIIFTYFALITLAFHYGIHKSSQGRPQVFVRYFMAATSIKLFMHLGVIVFYAFSNKAMAYNFILTFMVFYFVFTVFEVYFTFTGRKSKTQN
jgi:hypothetical protein